MKGVDNVIHYAMMCILKDLQNISQYEQVERCALGVYYYVIESIRKGSHIVLHQVIMCVLKGLHNFSHYDHVESCADIIQDIRNILKCNLT